MAVNKIANRAVMCEVLMENAKTDRQVTVLCSDSRGSASLTPFANAFPEQFVEVGIAEQNLVGIAAGMASCGKKAYAVSPASFLSTRSYEQAKVDCAYSRQNVKLVGISGGVSYGALGMTHHSAQDIAAMAAIPGMRVYIPSDRHQTRRLFQALLKDEQTAYIRLGRNPVEDLYAEDMDFTMNRAVAHGNGKDALIVACGEMVAPALDAARMLRVRGIDATVLDMHCVKPLDEASLLRGAEGVPLVAVVEEHAPWGGLGSMVCRTLASRRPVRTLCFSLPDEPVVAGTSQEVFHYYGLDGSAICDRIANEWKREVG